MNVVKDVDIGGAIEAEEIGTLEGVEYRLVDDVVINDGGIGGAGGIFDVFIEANDGGDAPTQKEH